MIATIIGILLILLGITLLIFAIKEGESELIPMLLTILGIFVIAVSLVIGSSPYKEKDKYLAKKHIIESAMQMEVSYGTIKEAEKYNRSIEGGNNYWCRFNIENRDSLKIDIDGYLKDIDRKIEEWSNEHY